MAIATSPASAANAYAALGRLGAPASAPPRPTETAGAGPDFSALLKDVINAVTDTGARADLQTHAAATGKANMVDVVTAVAESETAIAALVSVRDKVIAAYQEIMRMQM